MSGILGGLIGSFPAGAAGSFESIATSEPAGSNIVTFSSIPSTHQHLQIRAIMKSGDTSTTDPSNINVTFNGSTATNYASHRLFGNGSSVTADGLATQSNIRLTRISLNNNSAQANMFGVLIMDIHDYASTTKAKTVRSFYGNDVNAANSLIGATLHSGLWTSTSAIDSITFTLPVFSFTTGTHFALYGIKGA